MLYVLHLNYKSKELSTKNPLRRKLYIITVFCMVITLISVIDVLLLSTTLQPLGISCKSLMFNRAFAYCLLRWSFWYYNLLRLDIVFYGTALAYTKKFIRFGLYSLISVTIFLLILFIWGIFIGNGYIILLSPYNSCVANMKPIIAITVALLEAITNITLFWLFYRKIKDITSSSDDKDGTIMYITRKYLVLIAVATISTWSFVVFAVITDLPFTIASIDSMINLWCLVLFDKRLDHIYQIVFKCCLKKHDLDLKNIEQSIQESTTDAKPKLSVKVISDTGTTTAVIE